jgi:hypothetical protein
MKRVLAFLAVAVAVLVGCRGHSAGQAAGQGVSGVVLAGPTCPVETLESPCPPKPVPSISVQVLSTSGEVVDTTTTDGNGRFSVALDPGTYEVRATPGQQAFMSARPVDVTVRRGAFANVTIRADTGIR